MLSDEERTETLSNLVFDTMYSMWLLTELDSYLIYLSISHLISSTVLLLYDY